MFMNRKAKAFISVLSAVVLIVINTVSVAASPFGTRNVDDIREKALGKYLASNSVFSAVSNISLAPKPTNPGETNLTIYSDIVETQPVDYNTIKRLNTSLQAGEVQTVREGVSGVKSVEYKVKYEAGIEVSKEVVSETVTTPPVDKIVEYGGNGEYAGGYVDTSKLDYKYVLTCTATAYDLSAEENGGYAGQTATGVPLDKGVIAVDPKVIPLGSRVYIEALDGSWSYGYAVAADTGGAIKGNRVDLCYRTRSECIQFGRRPCKVYVLN